MDARLDRSPAQGLAAHVESRFIPVPPGAPRFSRRPGRRRARRPAAFAGGRAVARLPVGRRPAQAPAPGTAPFEAPLPIPRQIRDSRIEIVMRAGRGPGPSRPEDQDVDLRRHLPGADDQAPGGRAHRGHLQAPSAPRRRRADRPPARRPQPQRVRRPARRPDQLPAALLLLPDTRGTAGAPLRQRPADRAGLGEDLRLRPARGRRPRTRRLRVVPRPSPRPHRSQRLARPGRNVDRRRPRSTPRWGCRAATATCR